jgi:hypothetical protein
MSVSISWIVALGSFSSVKSPNMRSISCCHFGISGKGRQGTWFFLCLTVSSVSLVIVLCPATFSPRAWIKRWALDLVIETYSQLLSVSSGSIDRHVFFVQLRQNPSSLWAPRATHCYN